MTVLKADELKFTSADGRLWKRKLFGQEAQVAWLVDKGNGFTYYCGTVTLHFTPVRAREELLQPIQRAWIRARHLAPAIACTSVFRDGQYWYEYQVPNEYADAESWATKTIIWHEEKKTLIEVALVVKEKWYMASEGRYAIELHMFPSSEVEGEWHMSFAGPHNSMDARAMMKIAEYVLICTLEELSASPAAGSLGLNWGEETVRLAPALIIAAELPFEEAPEPQLPQELPADVILFLPGFVETDEMSSADFSNVNTHLVLSKEETTRYRAAGRAHGATVTSIAMAIHALAEVETMLQLALNSGMDTALYEQNVGSYEKATHFLFGFYFMNHRHKFPGAYKTLEDGALLFGTEGTSPLFDMTKIRRAVKFQHDAKRIVRETSSAVLWDEIVGMSSSITRSTPSGWDSIFQREVDRQLVLDSGLHDDSTFDKRVTIFSSVGDYAALDILNPFVPNSGALSKELAVTQQYHSVRATHPTITQICWAYADQLNFCFLTARRWSTQESLELFKKNFKNWLDILVDGAV